MNVRIDRCDRRACQHVVELIAQNNLPGVIEAAAPAIQRNSVMPTRDANRNGLFGFHQQPFKARIAPFDIVMRGVDAAMILQVQLVLMQRQSAGIETLQPVGRARPLSDVRALVQSSQQ